VVSDEPQAPGVEIGKPAEAYRRVRIESQFGKLTALVTDGHLPYPYGREMTGYEVSNFAETLTRPRPPVRMCLFLRTRRTSEMLLLSGFREDTSRRSIP